MRYHLKLHACNSGNAIYWKQHELIQHPNILIINELAAVTIFLTTFLQIESHTETERIKNLMN